MTKHPRNVLQVTVANLWIILAQLRDMVRGEVPLKPLSSVWQREGAECNIPRCLVVGLPDADQFIDLGLETRSRVGNVCWDLGGSDRGRCLRA